MSRIKTFWRIVIFQCKYFTITTREAIAALVLIVVLSFTLIRCDALNSHILTKEEYVVQTDLLLKEEEGIQEEWNKLLSNTKFEDLCTEVYAIKFEELGQAFIDKYDAFMNLKVEGKKETIIQDYKQYLQFFETYRDIGKELQSFASSIRNGKYEEALTVISNLQVLNEQIPIID